MYSLLEKCPFSEFYWSVFSRIRTECGKILHISPYSVQLRENKDQKNSEYGHFLRCDWLLAFFYVCLIHVTWTFDLVWNQMLIDIFFKRFIAFQ